MLLGPEFGQEPWLSPLRVVGACLASSSDIGPPGAEAGENGKNKSGKPRSSPSLSLTQQDPFLDPWSEAFLGKLPVTTSAELVLLLSYFSRLSGTIYLQSPQIAAPLCSVLHPL